MLHEKKIRNFDFSTFSFYGHSLIESSAGTGKTHIIVILYLRLLLGINNNSFKALPIEKILVLTFTKVAVEELYERIKNGIHELRSACLVGYSQNPFFLDILKSISDIHLVYQRLLEAEKKIDKAQIFTIHGFCQNILNMYPMELHSIFRYSILEDEYFLFQKSCNDFWRRHFYILPIEILNIIEDYWKHPDDLLKEVYPYLFNMEINIQPFLKENIIIQHTSIINYINYVKKIWFIEQDKLIQYIDSCFLNRHIYSSRNLKNWFKNINFWINKKNIKNYEIPKELKYFRHSVITNNINASVDDFNCTKIIQHPLFEIIENLFKKTKSLKQLILQMAIHEIREISKGFKQLSAEISFNDLIHLLDDALHDSKRRKQLANLISSRYPITIIDECQDTNFEQYRIFRALYSLSQSKYGLILIGDPKQAIYSFRGADIFSYFLIRKNINFHYTLNINWRSSASMVNAINTLFKFNSLYPFVFQNILFSPVESSSNGKKLFLIVKNKLYPALYFCVPMCNRLTLYQFRKVMVDQCSNAIYDLLNSANKNDVWLQSGESKRLLEASDIVVLVRDRNEGFLISSALKKLNIETVYLSNQQSLFTTEEAIDLLFLLEAVVFSENHNILRCALMTKIIGYNAEEIDYINQNEDSWSKEFSEFNNYYFFWKKYGVQSMLQEIMFRRKIPKRLLSSAEGEQYLINILHLSEILQEKSGELKNERSLIRWLIFKINSQNIYSSEQLLRLRSDSKLVKIITIHQAKGLEFPLVFLPFIPNIYRRQYPLFHDRKNYQLHLDLCGLQKNFDFSEEERLSEDVRLFYVAITRAIYYCFIGIGAIFFKKYNMKNISDLHRTALGHLIQNGVPGDFLFLKECLKKLVECANGDIVFDCVSLNKNRNRIPLINNMVNYHSPISNQVLSAQDWKRPIDYLYKVTSYSELHRSSQSSRISISNFQSAKMFSEKNNDDVTENINVFTQHTFPRGNLSGDCLHDIFQKWNFRKEMCNEWWVTQLTKSGINLVWLPVIQNWVKMVSFTPLDGKDLMLSNLSSKHYSSELQFYLSIKNIVSSEMFEKISRNHDPISRLSSPLNFSKITGMLHGFIDLLFFWKGKYYLLDYKSNWLGDTCSSYNTLNMECAMIAHHYALQYQIYTLAVHRFLRHKLLDYNYEKYFGGVYYLFLRGIDLMHSGYGIYFCRPNQFLIESLDKLL